VGNLRQDLSFAIRSLGRQPGFAAVVLATLALGIGATTTMFSVVNGVLLKPLPLKDPDRLTLVRIVGSQGALFPIPDADFLAWRANHPAFQHVAAFSASSFNLTGSGSPEIVRGAWVSGDFFSTIGVEPALGRLMQPHDDEVNAPAVVVLAHRFWVQRFNANPAVIGTTLRLNDVPCTIVGVAPPGVVFPRPDLDLWRSNKFPTPSRRGPFYMTGIGRLAAGATSATAVANLDAVSNGLKQQYGGPSDWRLESVALTEAIVGDARTPLYLLLAAVGFLLLISLANVANLLLARATTRQRELAVRAALGAAFGRLTRQLLTEAALLGAVGGLLGVLAALALTAMMQHIGTTDIPRFEDVQLDARVLLFAIAISFAGALLFGAGPALFASREDLVSTLAGGNRAGVAPARRRAQRALVVAEIALALMLSIGGALFMRSLMRLQTVDMGFDSRQLLTFSIALPQKYDPKGASKQFFDQLLARLQALPGVQSAALAVSIPPDQLLVTDNFTVEGTIPIPGQSAPTAPFVVASDRYFATMRIPLVDGRLFDARDRLDSEPIVIVSRSLAQRYYPGGRAVGRRFRIGGPERPDNAWMRVVGVVGDVKYEGLAMEAGPAFYLPFSQQSWASEYVVIRATVPPASLVSSVREAVWSIDREIPLARIRTMDEIVSQASAQPRFRTLVLAAFGLVGLTLALVGVYGLISYSVAQRTREMGIRTALGAQRRDLVTLVLRDAAALAGVGVVLGLIGAFAVTRLSATLLFGVSPTDPGTFVGAAAVLTTAALAASWIPARRAARVNPTTALNTNP
jgi:predicted permease